MIKRLQKFGVNVLKNNNSDCSRVQFSKVTPIWSILVLLTITSKPPKRSETPQYYLQLCKHSYAKTKRNKTHDTI